MEYATWIGESESYQITWKKKYPIVSTYVGGLNGKSVTYLTIYLNDGQSFQFLKGDKRFKLGKEVLPPLEEEIYTLKEIGYRNG